MFQKSVGNVPLSSLPSITTMFEPLIRQQMEEYPVFSKSPIFFRTEALFPYIQGATFIEKALNRGGWKSLKALFTSPPTSTKEIFQPTVYFNHESLPKVKLPNPTPLSSVQGLKKVDENTMGELGFDSLLGQFLLQYKANATSSNWMGDRYIVYENSAASNYALVARTRWTNPKSALEFFRDYHTVLTKKYPGLTPDPHSIHGRFVAHTASGEVIMVQKGDEVRWAEGVPKNKINAMSKWLESLQR